MVSVLRNKMVKTNFQTTLDDILKQAMKINRAKLGNMQVIKYKTIGLKSWRIMDLGQILSNTSESSVRKMAAFAAVP
jgi:hypothetical protein